MKLLGAVSDRFLQGIVLALAAPFASMGVTLGCFVRNLLFYPPDAFGIGDGIRMPGTGWVDLAFTVLLAMLALFWLLALVRFIRAQPRSVLTIVVAVISAIAFCFSAWGNWQMAYPVCNAF